MNFDHISLTEEDKLIALKSFVAGDSQKLFNAVFSSLYRKHEVAHDSDFIFNVFANMDSEFKNNFFDFFKEYSKISTLYEIKNPFLKEKDIAFWGLDLVNKPLIFCLVPYLKDEQLSYLIKKSDFYNIEYDEQNQKIANTLFLKLFENKYVESLNTLKTQYSFTSTIDLDKQNNGKPIQETLFDLCEDNFEMIEALSRYAYHNKTELRDKWLGKYLKNENNLVVANFIDKKFNDFEPIEKEKILSQMLKHTKDLDLFYYMLNKMGYSSLNDYQAKKVPLWECIVEHENFNSIKKLFKDGLDYLDYHEVKNNCLANELHRYKDLHKLNINNSSIWKKLLSPFSDNDKITKFSVLCNIEYSSIGGLLNQNLDNMDLSKLNKSLKSLKYNNLNDLDKLSIIETLLNRTWFSPKLEPVSGYLKNKLNDKTLAIESFLYSQYHLTEDIWQFSEHLNLMDKLPQKYISNIHQENYFKTIKALLTSPLIKYINQNNPTYIKIIDYIAPNDKLPWNEISTVLQKVDKNTETNHYICNYLTQICLSHSLKDNIHTSSSKIKI